LKHIEDGEIIITMTLMSTLEMYQLKFQL